MLRDYSVREEECFNEYGIEGRTKRFLTENAAAAAGVFKEHEDLYNWPRQASGEAEEAARGEEADEGQMRKKKQDKGDGDGGDETTRRFGLQFRVPRISKGDVVAALATAGRHAAARLSATSGGSRAPLPPYLPFFVGRRGATAAPAPPPPRFAVPMPIRP